MRIVMGGASAMLAVRFAPCLSGVPPPGLCAAVGGVLPKVYFGFPRPVPARGSKGLQRGETGLRGAAGLCAAAGVRAWRTGARTAAVWHVFCRRGESGLLFVALGDAAQAGAFGRNMSCGAALRLVAPDNMWVAQTSSKCGQGMG